MARDDASKPAGLSALTDHPASPAAQADDRAALAGSAMSPAPLAAESWWRATLSVGLDPAAIRRALTSAQRGLTSALGVLTSPFSRAKGTMALSCWRGVWGGEWRGLIPRGKQRRVAVFWVALCFVSLIPMLYWSAFKSPIQRSSFSSQQLCPCLDVEKPKEDLRRFQAKIKGEDEAALSSVDGGEPLEPKQQLIRMQQRVLEEQQQELQMLVEAARARRMALLGDASSSFWGKQRTPLVISEDQPAMWQQRTFSKHAAYGFVSFSSYRISPTLIIVLGFGSLRIRDLRRLESCQWVSDSGKTVKGTLGVASMNEHHYYLYEPLLMNCTFPEDKVEYDISDKFLESKEGGYLQVQLDREVFYPYVEKQGYKIHQVNSSGPFQYERVFCGPPMFGTVNLPAVMQWLAYHRYHAGFDHFILYDAGAVSAEFRLALGPLVDEGLVTIQDFREAISYDIWAQNQALAMHDCLFRNRETARWVFFHDFDEYLESPSHNTIPGLLQQHEAEPYLTHGSYVYSMSTCQEKNVWDPRHAKFAVEMILFRWEQPFCIKSEMDPNVCTDYYGMRKIIANPRKVLRTYIHHTALPPDGSGVDLPISELWHSHFKRLILPAQPCSGEREQSEKLKKVDSLARIAAKARECAREGFANLAKCQPRSEP